MPLHETATGSRYETTRRAWEKIWNTASIEAELATIQYPRGRAVLEAYLPYLNKEDVLLEAGSGLSAVVITLRRMGYTIIGLDYAENALHLSRQYDPELTLLAGDVHALPCADNSVGAYLSFGVLEHFEHGMQPALKEAYRILKPGGVLVLTIPYPNLIWRLAQWRRQRAGKTLIDESFYESTYSRQALLDNVTAAGFDIASIQPTGHSYTLWGIGGIFRAEGYYRTSALAEALGQLLRWLLPWHFNFTTLVIGKKLA